MGDQDQDHDRLVRRPTWPTGGLLNIVYTGGDYTPRAGELGPARAKQQLKGEITIGPAGATCTVTPAPHLACLSGTADGGKQREFPTWLMGPSQLSMFSILCDLITDCLSTLFLPTGGLANSCLKCFLEVKQ